MRRVSLAFASVLASVALHAADATSGRFTVADSIEMVRIVDAAETARFSADGSTTAIRFSPDRSRFTLVTRNGNLKTGQNEYRLLLFSAEEVLRFVRSRGSAPLPHPEVLATFEIAQPRTREDGISHVKWMADSETLAFIGRGEDSVGQLYSFHLRSRQLRKLTQFTENVVGFDLTPEQKALIFVQKPSPNWSRRNTHGYAVKSDPLNYLVTKDPGDAFREFTYFAADFQTGRLTPVHSEAGFAVAPSVTALSPTGRSAVVLRKVATVPAIWAQYDFLQPTLALTSRHGSTLKSAGDGARSQAIDEDWYGGGAEEPWRLQFALVDMTSGTSESLVDAPISVHPGPMQAAWSLDGLSVVVGGTYLPLHAASGDELDRRSRFPAIAEIDVATGKIARVAEIRPRDAANGQPIFLSSFHRMDDDWVVIRERVRGAGLELPLRSFRKRRGSWREERGPTSLPAIHGLKIIISQDNDTPPELAAVDLKTSRRHVFTDLNPRFRSLPLGKTEKFEWTDRFGRHFAGGLLLPPDFKGGVRYPAVIQNYAYDATQFLVDGVPAGVTSAFAARPLASRGILVLQMDADFRPAGLDDQASRTSADWLRRAESPLALVSIEGAIDALDARSLIDPSRVGLIGWSRSGMHALHAITFGCRPIAAVSIADSHGTTPWIYVSAYGRGAMVDWESDILIGAPFWGDGIRLWQERSPAFHLDRIRTPLRYEHYGTYPPSFWDTFVMLKRHSRPVEMIHLPLAKHNLESPHARFTSQEGNVDWFDFWLTGHEDPDPAKSDQYNRWRKLRAQHEAHLRDVHPGSPTWNNACAASSGKN